MKKKTLINIISMEFLLLRWRFFSLQDVLVARSQERPLYSQTTNLKTYNRRQNELRHFALNWAFCMLYWLQKEEIQLFLPHPLHAMLCWCLSYLQKTTNTPTLIGGGAAGCGFCCSLKFKLYPIWVHWCLNNNILSPIVGWILHWLNMRTDFTYKNNLILPLVTSVIFFSKSCKNNRCMII